MVRSGSEIILESYLDPDLKIKAGSDMDFIRIPSESGYTSLKFLDSNLDPYEAQGPHPDPSKDTGLIRIRNQLPDPDPIHYVNKKEGSLHH